MTSEHVHAAVQGRRRAAGLTQQQLADQVGLSRQSYNAIEARGATPSTAVALRLARALGTSVEDLFSLSDERLSAEWAGEGAAQGSRVALARIGERWVAHPLAPDAPLASLVPADGVVAARPARTLGRTVPVRLLGGARPSGDRLLCMGCAPALGLLTARTTSPSGAGLLWLEASSDAALESLRLGQVHLAGTHLFDERSGEFNVPVVAEVFGDRRMQVVNFARWEAGLVVAPGNPRQLKRIEHLGRAGVTVVRRAAGSGAERLLARALKAAGVPLERLHSPSRRASSHWQVAQAVAFGAADAGIAIRSVALAHGLGFVPLAEERFDLVYPRELETTPALQRVLQTLNGRALREELRGLGGYDTRQTGSIVGETGAAA